MAAGHTSGSAGQGDGLAPGEVFEREPRQRDNIGDERMFIEAGTVLPAAHPRSEHEVWDTIACETDKNMED